jgi:hypothetical protein
LCDERKEKRGKNCDSFNFNTIGGESEALKWMEDLFIFIIN